MQARGRQPMSGKMLLPRPRLRLERGRPRRPLGGCQRHPMVQFMERHKTHLDQHSQLRRRPQDAWVAKVRVGHLRCHLRRCLFLQRTPNRTRPCHSCNGNRTSMGIGGTAMDNIGGMAMDVHIASLHHQLEPSPRQHRALVLLGSSSTLRQ